VLPGILPLAPTFAVIALLAVGAKGNASGFRETCLAGVKTIPAYLAFLGACWLFIDKVDYRLAVLGGIAVCWLRLSQFSLRLAISEGRGAGGNTLPSLQKPLSLSLHQIRQPKASPCAVPIASQKIRR
jgi:uncharacterized membrane protein (GlpM family)